MFPLIGTFIHAFFYDALAVRRWVRGGLGALAFSGVAFSQQLAAYGYGKIGTVVAIGAAFSAFAMQSSAKKNGNGPTP
jgi:hypothetical protein